MNIDDLTLAQLREVAKLACGLNSSTALAEPPHPLLGKIVLIRTVTLYYTGRVVAVTPVEIAITDAAWIADTGRFSDALAVGGQFSEVEPYPDGRVVYVSRGAVIDWCEHYTAARSKK